MKSFILCIVCIFFVYGLVSFFFTLKNKSFTTTPYIIKTLNEEGSIEGKLRFALMRKCEIIVVDLGSTDDTKEIVKKMAQDYPCISLIEKEQC